MLALLNPNAGSAQRARAALQSDPRFYICEREPSEIADSVRAEALRGSTRLLVCGGDGTLSTAFGAAAGTSLELAILPGGTLNHFARDFGVPVNNPARALDFAVNGTGEPVDLGYVNGHAILNTSSVGVYVEFVRRRERHEQRMPYPIASAAAAGDVWRNPPDVLDVSLQTADGAMLDVRTPLLFVGIHERVLTRVRFGARRTGGVRALQVFVVKKETRSDIQALALRAAARGIQAVIGDDDIECHLTSKATVALPWPVATVALDGELLQLTSPLVYEFAPGAVKVVRGAKPPVRRADRDASAASHRRRRPLQPPAK
jgi:diacylglycerol kinase family enzyme